jgi:putative tryptophan/tyrosine transport system substrate-binding protein
MHRREFIGVLGGAALIRPFEARALESAPLIGLLHEGHHAPLSLTVAFQQGLIQGGVGQGSSVRIENISADGMYDRLPALAAELVDRRVGVIAAAYLVAARAAEAATQTVPIVFITGSDPVAAGLVSSISRPTGNMTGVAFFFTRLGEKNLATLHELVPGARVVGALVNPNNPNAGPQARDLEEAVQALGLQLVVLEAGTDSAIEKVFANLSERRIEALLVTADGFFFGLQTELAKLAARHAVPAFYPLSDYVTAGGLISYGANLSESWRQAGIYAARILKGAKPTDLPIMQSEKFELAINLKTAKALNLAVPASLVARADVVVE